MENINRLLLDRTNDIGRDLQRRTMKVAIAEKIAGLIASGVLQKGDELPGERDLAAALSVSRETVRGAVGALASDGILEVAHGARTRVASSDLSELDFGTTIHLDVNRYSIDTVHQSRLLIEQAVVGDAAERIDDETLALLSRLLDAQERCLRDPVRFLISDREFHIAIYRACGNPLLADVVTDLYTYMMEHRRRVMALPDAIPTSLADHRSIHAALTARDRDAAVAAFGIHEQRIYRTTCALLHGERDEPET
ncbi:FadR/GntR family transcriptional regulator [Tranquillimonas rosea]|uniref:FadR/GntR family transcriptional regulator n=1 Tax=Tranquillimonas rosea TaxID=641238 RepID=UPI003BA9209E